MKHRLVSDGWRSEFERFYNYCGFHFRPFKIMPRMDSKDVIVVSRWNDGLPLKKSVRRRGFWVAISNSREEIVLDDRVIIALADELKRLRKEVCR